MPNASKDNVSVKMDSKPSVLNAWIWTNALKIPVDLHQFAQILEEATIANANLDLLVLHRIHRVKVIDNNYTYKDNLCIFIL